MDRNKHLYLKLIKTYSIQHHLESNRKKKVLLYYTHNEDNIISGHFCYRKTQPVICIYRPGHYGELTPFDLKVFEDCEDFTKEMIVFAHELGHFKDHLETNNMFIPSEPKLYNILSQCLRFRDEVRAWKHATVLLKKVGYKFSINFYFFVSIQLLGYMPIITYIPIISDKIRYLQHQALRKIKII